MISFTVYGPPKAQARQKITTVNGKPRTYTPKDSADYRTRIRDAATEAMAGRPLIDSPCCVFIQTVKQAKINGWNKAEREWLDAGGLYIHDRKPDADNHAKQHLDALNGVVWVDDARVVSLHVLKLQGREPRATVTVWPLHKLFWTDESIVKFIQEIQREQA